MTKSEAKILMENSKDKDLIYFFKNGDKNKKIKMEACKKEIEKRGLKVN